MIKKFILSTIVIISIIGCSDKKDEKTVEKEIKVVKEIEVVQEAPLSIEIQKNTNSNEIKVEEKVKTEKENGTFYYDYNVKNKTKNEVKEKPRTKLDANMHVRSPYERVKVSLLVNKLSKEFIVKCSACHNDYANGIIGPSLLSKDSDFIFKRIMEFKKDENKNVLMSGLVKQMSEKEIRKIANEIYQFNKEIKEMK